MIFALMGYVFKANRNEQSRKHYLYIVFGMIIFVAMFRSDQVGIDLRNYYNKYFPVFRDASWGNLQRVTISGDWELGFCAFCKLIGYISTDTQCFVIFTSIFCFLPYALFIYKNSDDVVFSTVFFLGYHVYMMSMNIVRQAMAVGIILIGFEALKRKQYIKYLIYVGIAALFHTSAVVAVLLILCDRLRFKRNTFFVLAVVTAGVGAAYRVLFEAILRVSSLSFLYGIYSATGPGDSGGYVTFHTLGMFGIALAVFVYCYSVYNCRSVSCRPYSCKTKIRRILFFHNAKIQIKKVRMDSSIYWSESMLMYATYLAVFFRFSAFLINVTARFAMYFIPFLMIAFPHAVNKEQKSLNRKIAMVSGLAVILVFFIFLGFTRAGVMWGTVPYHFFME